MMLRARSAVGAKLRLAGAWGERVCGGAPLARAAFTRGFLDLHKMANKEAIEKEKARLTDEMSRGYFADISEIRKNAGKIAMANKIIIPEIVAMRFPDLAVESPDGRALQLPLVAPTPQDDDREAGDAVVPDASLVCLSFRASSLIGDDDAEGAVGAKLRLAGTRGERVCGGAPLARAAFTRGFLDLQNMANKEAIEKEKARLTDEMSRGYFADISEIRKNAGKMANKIIIPEIAAMRFPDLAVESPDGKALQLPLVAPTPQDDDREAGDAVVPDSSLVCLSFRASSLKMAESWTLPFLDAFGAAGKIQAYEVSFIDSWLLSSSPVRRAFLKVMRKSHNPQRQVVYAFGDHYDFRKKLQILNLLTGYIYLIDRLGRIRWQGFGSATQEELSSLTACTSILLDEK